MFTTIYYTRPVDVNIRRGLFRTTYYVKNKKKIVRFIIYLFILCAHTNTHTYTYVYIKKK